LVLKQFYIKNVGPAKIQRVQQKIPGCWTYVQQNENKFQKVWDDDEVHFVLDQHAKLDFYSTNSLKHAGRHVAPLGHIILIPSQLVFALFPLCCALSGEATSINFIALVWRNRSSNPWFTELESFEPWFEIKTLKKIINKSPEYFSNTMCK
jgi:hypothetical protein